MTAIEQIRAVVRASEWSTFGSSAEIRAGMAADETIRTHAHDWLSALLDVAEAAQAYRDAHATADEALAVEALLAAAEAAAKEQRCEYEDLVTLQAKIGARMEAAKRPIFEALDRLNDLPPQKGSEGEL